MKNYERTNNYTLIYRTIIKINYFEQNTSKIVVELNWRMWINSGTLKSTTFPWLLVLENISPPHFKQEDDFIRK